MKKIQLAELLEEYGDHLEVAVEMPNGSYRVIVDVEDGQVTGGYPIIVLVPHQSDAKE